MTNSIVLTMIVKDEGHVIERALESCYTMIDSYCIVDTGSTDDTKEKIKNFFDSKGIEGVIVDFPFTNFEECRNVSIKEGAKLGTIGFWMDADEILVLNDDFSKTKLDMIISSANADQMLIRCEYNDMKYNRAQFYKFSTGFEWYGPVHEILRPIDNKPLRVVDFTLGKMQIVPDGASWQEDISIKYEKHAEILLNYQNEHKWEDPRWTFYLAQSYRDAGQSALAKNQNDERGLDLAKKSIHYYKERANNPIGYVEERYYSQLMACRLMYYFNSNEVIMIELLRCSEIPSGNRIEHLFNLVSFLQSEGLHNNALLHTKEGLRKIKEGVSATLFIENAIYDWLLYDMHGVSLFHIGKFEEALKYFKYALKKGLEHGNIDNDNKKRVENNIKSAETELRNRK